MTVTINASAERPARTTGGIQMQLLSLQLMLGGAAAIILAIEGTLIPAALGAGIAGLALGLFALCGLYSLQPNEAMAILLFGDYRGTDRNTGLRWVLPWYTRKKVSMRVRNVTSDKLKVNDKRGNPIEIAANVRHGLTPMVNALAVVLIAVTVALALAYELHRRMELRRASRRAAAAREVDLRLAGKPALQPA